jgi:predicted nucleotidyltransferase
MTDELDKLIHKAADVLKSFGATDVYLFGSVAKGTDNEHSGTTMNAIKKEFDLVDLDEKNTFVEYLKSHGKLQRVI